MSKSDRKRASTPALSDLSKQISNFTTVVESQRRARKTKRWIAAATAVAAALVTGLLVVVTDFGASLSGSLKINEQIGPKIEEAVGPEAIRVINVERLGGSTGDVLLPEDAQLRETALNDPLHHGSTMEKWKDKYNLVSVGYVTWEIALETFREERIEITNMVPVLEAGKCEASRGGSLLENGSSGSIDKIRLDIDIDKPNPIFMAQLDRNQPSVPYFQYKQIGLEKGKKDAAILTARAENGYCKWRIRAEYYAAGAKHEILLGRPDGNHFELTARKPLEQYDFVVPDPLVCAPKGTTPQLITGKKYAEHLRGPKSFEPPEGGCR